MRCRATDVVTDCWKVHPERFPAVAESEISEAQEVTPLVISGD